jgi:hypothetical protein
MLQMKWWRKKDQRDSSGTSFWRRKTRMGRKKAFKTKPENQLTTRELWMVRIVEGLFFLLSLLAMFSCIEINEIDSNLHGTILCLIFAPIGVGFGYGIKVWADKRFPFIQLALKQRKTISLVGCGLFIAPMFLLPALANYYNRTNPLTERVCERYKVIRKGKSTHKGTTYFLYVNMNGSEEQLLPVRDIWKKTRENGEIELCTSTGGLGFPFVQEMRNVPD